MQSKVHNAAFAAVAIIAIGASVYAYRARDSAIRGWAYADQVALEAAARVDAANESAREAVAAAERSGIGPYRALWETILGGPKTDRSFVFAAASHVHQNIPLGNTDTKGTVYERYRSAMLGLGETALCGDFSVFLADILNRSGIPSRVVQLAGQDFVEGLDKYATHVTVEALVDGKWVIVDPTINATFACGSRSDLLDVAGVRACGEGVTANQLPGTLPGRGAETLTPLFADQVNYTVTRAAGVGGHDMPKTSYPEEGWIKRALALY